MSILIETPLGNFRKVKDQKVDGHEMSGYMWECPVCHQWGGLTKAQLEGRISVFCAKDNPNCTYHETHDFRPAIEASTAKEAAKG